MQIWKTTYMSEINRKHFLGTDFHNNKLIKSHVEKDVVLIKIFLMSKEKWICSVFNMENNLIFNNYSIEEINQSKVVSN